MKIAGIILAAGKGKRMNSHEENKVVLSFSGRPMIQYGAELFQSVCQKIIVVVGAYADSVKQVLSNYPVEFVEQTSALGTGHAVKVTLTQLNSYLPTQVLVGYGDHLMFYKKSTLENLISGSNRPGVAMSMVTTDYPDPDSIGFGRVIKDTTGHVARLVEQKDATAEERKITKLNAGLYCFSYDFLKDNIDLIEKSAVTGEYYLTDLVDIAIKKNLKVVEVAVPFSEVGIGVNTQDQLDQSQELFSKLHQ